MVNTKNLNSFISKLKSIESLDLKNKVELQISQRLLSILINKTSVVSGNLRRNWKAKKITNGIMIYNDVYYASYYNYGHRNRSGGWTIGRFTVEKSINQLNPQIERIVNNIVIQEIKKVLS